MSEFGSDPIAIKGVRIYPGWLSPSRQMAILDDLRDVARAAPFRRYRTPGGRQMSVRMTSAGDLGWVTDHAGYRYQDTHLDGQSWPDIPESILVVWREVSGVDRDPESCLVNYYGEGARMGMHQDRDEADLTWPVVSISLGDDALFRIGGVDKPAPSKSVWLRSGDVALIGGDARLAYHGIDRIRFGSYDFLPDGGRINVTLRVAR